VIVIVLSVLPFGYKDIVAQNQSVMYGFVGLFSKKGKPPSLTGRRFFSHCLLNQALYRFRLAAFSSQPFRHVRGEGQGDMHSVFPLWASRVGAGASFRHRGHYTLSVTLPLKALS